ncbi:hypothetical protein BDY19DRAFT_992328 [Irpex rosettiformis]|uniref:Uncharacterized protein n=1 Tax=Irpex rosettiformis TaxID=378272 RepID=A0ACB8U6X4_9APHY|nr:hypothetical protein BDY19DRAFT_992328 [Irpex rosettiformis]
MFLRTFICALILALTILLTVSPVEASVIPPTPAKRMTNAERMARGLPPNPPKLIRRSQAFAKRKGASKGPEPTPTET